ncbi:hypothetical protein CRG98_004183 [Punica granatum]|uniref:Glycosyltransferase 61 catalytic domain-containing protein n=1 Tax=Punica granatum TaxID=22663 RepID=A0A2I0L4F3_PUNGR|nr:hypothetical protein CRG98_004183 [Punica granatum]
MKKNSTALLWLYVVLVVALLVFQVNISATLWKLVLIQRDPHGTKSGTQRPIFRRGPLIQLKPRPNATSSITCDRSHQSYDICSIDAPTVLDPTNATFFLFHHSSAAAPYPPPEKIRPHPRKWEDDLMSRIREFTLTAAKSPAPCDVVHPVPAVVFSAGGYVGNVFHEFNDILIPLFITVHTIYSGSRDFIPVVDDATDRWAHKYADLFLSLSKYPILIINRTAGASRHCFPSASVGLISHGFMTINPELISTSSNLSHFRELLDRAYTGGDIRNAATMTTGERRPRLVFVVRGRGVGRVLLNQEKVRKAAEAAGFEVVMFKPRGTTPLKEAYVLINSSHALIGVHGAALTHMFFLRPGAVFVQVVPLGADWAADICYGRAAKVLGLNYLEYTIEAEESSLTEKYGRESRLIKDPTASRGEQWGEVMAIYLKEQNVTLDLIRFGGTLKEAYLRAKKFMEDEG